ncbi:MAG: hypothetical protein WAM11_13975 [Cyanobium sp.]
MSALTASLLLVTVSACSSQNTSYTMVGLPEDSSIPAAKRVSARIVIPEGRTRQEVVATLERAARELSDKTIADAAMVFAYRPGDPTDGMFSVGRAVIAPEGKWESAASNENKAITTELSDLYFSPKKQQPTLNEVITLKSTYSSYVAVSNEYGSWNDGNIIARVNNGTKASLLEIRKQPMGSQELVRFRVRVQSGTPTEGWVHAFDAGYK